MSRPWRRLFPEIGPGSDARGGGRHRGWRRHWRRRGDGSIGHGGCSPGEEEQQDHAGGDAHVSHVEGGKSDFAITSGQTVEVEEIDDMAAPDPVYEISDDAAKQASERNLSAIAVGFELVTPAPEREQGGTCDRRQRAVVPRELAPGRPGVAPVDPAEETRQDVALIAVLQGVGDNSLGDLIQ